jgi:hypothetical protein
VSTEPSIADNALDLPLGNRKAELLRWLSEEGRFALDTGDLLEMLCEKLTVLGAPIARATAHVRTLHPEFRGVSRIWRRGQSTECPSSDDLRLVRRFVKGGSGSSGLEFKRPATDAASVG